jgi:DUF1365 family protein
MIQSRIFTGKVYHKRFTPAEHAFTYSGYFIKISLSELDHLKNTFFSVNHFNLFSFYFRDHGSRDGSSLREFAKGLLRENKRSDDFDDIVIHTMPRLLGHVFNPVSFWYVMKDEKITSIIAEVNNTFGETHSYVLDPDDSRGEKVFHVSPFNRIEGDYKFAFFHGDKNERVDIAYFINGEKILFASVFGTPLEWSSKNFLKVFLKHPLHNFLTLAFIHFEALRLFLKKVPFWGKNGVLQ